MKSERTSTLRADLVTVWVCFCIFAVVHLVLIAFHPSVRLKDVGVETLIGMGVLFVVVAFGLVCYLVVLKWISVQFSAKLV
jgi:membrane protein YdbS with pleckstrin-like domain